MEVSGDSEDRQHTQSFLQMFTLVLICPTFSNYFRKVIFFFLISTIEIMTLCIAVKTLLLVSVTGQLKGGVGGG